METDSEHTSNANDDAFLFPSTLELPNPHSPSLRPVEPQCSFLGGSPAEAESAVSETRNGNSSFVSPTVSAASAHVKAVTALKENMDRMKLQHSSDLKRSIQEFIGLQRHLIGQLQDQMHIEFQDVRSALQREVRDSKNVLFLEIQKLLTHNAETNKSRRTSNAAEVAPVEGETGSTVQADNRAKNVVEERKSFEYVTQASMSALESDLQMKPDEEIAFEGIFDDIDQFNLYKSIIDSHMQNDQETFIAKVVKLLGLGHLLVLERPQNFFSDSVHSVPFIVLQSILIIANAVLMGYEANHAMVLRLEQNISHNPVWVIQSGVIFNVVFAVEVLYRILADRIWFFVGPAWAWNVLDIFIVVVSLAIDVGEGSTRSMRIGFVRMFRFLRAVRVVRLVRVLPFFRELRKMLFAIAACLASLAWAFVFLGLLMFIFSIHFLNGLTEALDEAAADPNSNISKMRMDIQEWFSDLPHTMLSLSAAVTGGADWASVREPLVYAGRLYTGTFLLYVLFVIVGVMNVLTGVFLENAGEFSDKDLIVQSEYMKIYGFVGQMLEVFKGLEVDKNGVLNWEHFQRCLEDEHLQAYLSYFGLEATHARNLFILLANQGTTIDVSQFVLGILRLRGEAKAMDTRIIRREIGLLRPFIAKTCKTYSHTARLN